MSPLNYGRAHGSATVQIDEATCTVCGLCVKVCKGGPLWMEDGNLYADQTGLFGCIGCGQCAAVCPSGSIIVRGRDLFPEDLVDLPPYDQRAGYDSLQGLLLSRRSVRSFQEREVEPELVEKILHAASTAPMGLPPSEVGVLVFSGRARVKAFRDDLLKTLASWRWMTRPLVLTLMRPFLGKLNYEAFKEFVGPVIDAFIEKDRQGVDWFFYSAPLAIYFYASAWADPGDPYIAATYAMVAGQALGLGSCMLGFPGYAVRYDRKLRQKYRLPQAIQPGMVVIFGYPAVRYQRGILRRFAEVRYI